MSPSLKILCAVGARPNFVKLAPIYKELKNRENITCLICHTGQHYDNNMSEVFLTDLCLSNPEFHLGVGSGTHGEQTGKIMIRFEKLLFKVNPNLVIVFGDVNSTLACCLAAVKIGIKVAHIESGLRSFDRTMPEEINRLITDAISDYLFVSEKSGLINLKKEGIPDKKIFFVGNTMIDSLVSNIKKVEDNILYDFELKKNNYILITMHRPNIVDDLFKLKAFMEMLVDLSKKRKIIFPLHPRTKRNIAKFINTKFLKNIVLTEPLGYLSFISLLKNAEIVITDSGGVQEETTYLGIQCVTVRDNTERPVTVEMGTNHLAGTDMVNVKNIVLEILNGNIKSGKIPELWDGKAAKRIVKILLKELLCAK